MKRKSYILAFAIVLGLCLRVSAQWVQVSATPTPLIIPIGQSVNGSFVIELLSDQYGDGLFGAAFEVGLFAPYQGLSITSANMSAAVFTPIGTSQIYNNIGSAFYPVGTQLTINYTVTSDGTGSVGDATTIYLNLDDGGSGLPYQFSNAPATLPVTLARFDAQREGNTALLTWKTTEESNSDFFDIEHSLNARDWVSIGMVKSKNGGIANEEYSFTYGGVKNGTNYFRLKMVDLDGSFARSVVRSLSFGNLKDQVSFGPNPVSDVLTFTVSDMSQIENVSLIDKNGLNVYSSRLKNVNSIDVAGLRAGVYFLRLVSLNGEIVTKKVIVSGK